MEHNSFFLVQHSDEADFMDATLEVVDSSSEEDTTLTENKEFLANSWYNLADPPDPDDIDEAQDALSNSNKFQVALTKSQKKKLKQMNKSRTSYITESKAGNRRTSP